MQIVPAYAGDNSALSRFDGSPQLRMGVEWSEDNLLVLALVNELVEAGPGQRTVVNDYQGTFIGMGNLQLFRFQVEQVREQTQYEMPPLGIQAKCRLLSSASSNLKPFQQLACQDSAVLLSAAVTHISESAASTV